MTDHDRTSGSRIQPRSLAVAMEALLTLCAVAAAVAMVWQYASFGLTSDQVSRLQMVTTLSVGIFVLDRLARLLLIQGRKDYLRSNWIDFALLGGAGIGLLVAPSARQQVISAAALYMIIMQGYVLLMAIHRGHQGRARLGGGRIHPALLLLAGYIAVSLAGAGLLTLPGVASPGKSVPFHDGLFTAVSACCLTGLSVYDIATDFTPVGQAIILILIQLGGLAMLTFGTILAGLVGRSLTGQSADGSGLSRLAPPTSMSSNLGQTVRRIAAVALGLEALGAVLCYPMFAAARAQLSATPARAVWDSIFHSVSAFCNSGFSLYSQNFMEGVRSDWPVPLRDHWQVLGVLAPLIVLGGLGMPVLSDLGAWMRSLWTRRPSELDLASGISRPGLTLHSRLVLTATTLLIAIGASGLLLVEPAGEHGRYGAIGRTPVYYENTRNLRDWPRLDSNQRLRQAIFQSVSARTGGFSTIDMSELSDAGKLWMCGLMMIGGSPAGAAGGMKTVTLVLLLAAAWSAVRGRDDAKVLGQPLPMHLLRQAVAVATLYLMLVGVITLLLCMAIRTGYNFIDLFFEACSACGNVGFSTGLTSSLNIPARLALILGMLLGRLGILVLLLSLATRAEPSQRSEPILLS